MNSSLLVNKEADVSSKTAIAEQQEIII